MKYYSKKMILLSLFILLNYGNNALSYTFHITNFTGQDVKVEFYWTGGQLNKKVGAAPIKLYDTQRFSFKGWEIGLCLIKIKVSTKESGTWLSRPVQIKFVSDEQLKELGGAGFLGYIILEGLNLWELTGCGNKDFILVTDSDSGKILAITSTKL